MHELRRESPSAKRSDPQRLVRIARRLGGQIPPDEVRRIPKDLSAQVDHYVYGLPKR